MIETRIQKHIDELVIRYPQLEVCKIDIENAYLTIEEAYHQDKKLLIAGNGGSAADCEHIAGELMKRFKIPRPVPIEFVEKLKAADEANEAKRIRTLRDKLLAECDYIMLSDVDKTEEEKEAWKTYRQALRDIPEQSGFPWDVVFPEKP